VSVTASPSGYKQFHLHLHLKYGRDVLKTKSGTCINTAIFYASVAEAAGLEAHIYLVPGHAFPVVRLPESRDVRVPVESTWRDVNFWRRQDKSLEDDNSAVGSAIKTCLKYRNTGLLLDVNLHKPHENGVTPPELPNVGNNPLKDWGIVDPDQVPSDHPGVPAPPPGGPLPGGPPPGGPPPGAPTAADLVGKWKAPSCTFELNRQGTFSVLLDGTPATQRVFGIVVDNRSYGTYSYENGTLTLTYPDLFGLSESGQVVWHDKPSALLVGGHVWKRLR